MSFFKVFMHIRVVVLSYLFMAAATANAGGPVEIHFFSLLTTQITNQGAFQTCGPSRPGQVNIKGLTGSIVVSPSIIDQWESTLEVQFATNLDSDNCLAKAIDATDQGKEFHIVGVSSDTPQPLPAVNDLVLGAKGKTGKPNLAPVPPPAKQPIVLESIVSCVAIAHPRPLCPKFDDGGGTPSPSSR